jgi:hypothetical protein
MGSVITVVTGQVSPARVQEVVESYREAVGEGLPPGLETTFLVEADPGSLAIISVWHRREDLDAMLATGEEPLARRLIRTAGGTPALTIYGVLARA